MANKPLFSEEQKKTILQELKFTTFIIQGAGGQNLQKSQTGALLIWNVLETSLEARIKGKIIQRLKDLDRPLKVQFKSQIHRSLGLNKKETIEKLFFFLEKLLYIPPKRVPTKPTYSSKIKKINSKKRNSELKKTRQKVKLKNIF
ncbi:MAG: hypothetical protein KDD45_16935 [Bdellovibrionales bacterium]|nr:hypothetical protein [Bdellovibrionales bacterium]